MWFRPYDTRNRRQKHQSNRREGSKTTTQRSKPMTETRDADWDGGGGSTPEGLDGSLASSVHPSHKVENQGWRTAQKTNYKIKFSSVAPSGVDFQLNKDSNWDPNSVAEDWRFPWIYDPIVYQDYLDHQRDCLNVKSMFMFKVYVVCF